MNNVSTGAPNRATRERQAAVIFDHIGSLASTVERMGVMLVANDNDDERDIAAFQTAIKALSSQIGWSADLGSALCGGFCWRSADATKWMLPPSYHSSGNSGEQQ